MAHLGGFDASKVDPAGDFTPIPAGTYLAVMSESAMKKTKSGSGEYLECKWRISDGQHKGRVIISRLNLRNANSVAVQIAEGELSAICRAVGVLKPNDSSDLHNIPLEINIGVSEADEKGRLYNEVNGYSKRGTSEVVAPTAGGRKPSWMDATK